MSDEHISFLKTYYSDEIAELAQHYPNERSSLWISYRDVFAWDHEEAEYILTDPERTREVFEEALAEYPLGVEIDLSGARVRFHDFGTTETKNLEELRDGDVERYRAVSGQISKASAVRPIVKRAAWECQRCGVHSYIEIDTELKRPHECQGCGREGPFEFDYRESTVANHQLVRIKQPPEDATNSAQIGNELDAHIEGDLAGEVNAGERADVCGVLHAKTDENSPELDFYFNGWAVDSREDDYRELDIAEHKDAIREHINDGEPFAIVAESIAPGITGGDEIDIETPWGETYDKYWWLRLAAAVSNLFGSWRRPNGDGTYQRGSSHTLLIGDPSTGKSSIMGAIEQISPRSASESGRNASGPGLTAAAVQDDFGGSQWSLEAGALVKAHNGVACIDEIDKMQKDGLSRLHSALEKQRLEINKAGIDATLKCETSLLAAGNPEDSRFNQYDTDHAQIDIVSSLLDRFDLVFTLKDSPDPEKDEKIAETVIEQRAQSGLLARGDLSTDEKDAASPAVSPERMRAWVAYARQSCEPVLTDETVKRRLKNYYVEIRQANDDGNNSNDDNPVPATVRTLDGLLRLAEACARLRLSDEVEAIDAEMAIALVKVSLQDIGYDPETGKMDADYASGRGSWSNKDRRKKLHGIIGELQSEEADADVDNIKQTAEAAGIDPEKVDGAIQTLKDKGEIYEPSNDKFRQT